ncbi:patatin family protein [Shewanella insulae]|uniref:patatin-like phospholipase family protein n=1 Tax=Shewanella insulae TaxID=2681496 RepID=UPI001EFE9D63|nr:patatin family protein [Shewanella insulae]MCG9737051.1 patatin family protein [Shewanella insulae]
MANWGTKSVMHSLNTGFPELDSTDSLSLVGQSYVPEIGDNKLEKVLTPVQCNTALIAEGGGQRGIFTAGVLDVWLERGYNPFALLIGTSAGAQNLSSYLTGQIGFAKQAIKGLSRDPHFVKVRRGLAGKSTVDLDWFFNQVQGEPLGLDLSAGMRALNHRQLLFSMTNGSNYQAIFRQPNKQNWLELLKASSALPFLYRQGVPLEDSFYVDGGLSAPLPVEEAYRRGATKIVVIRTMPEEYQAYTPWVNRLKSWICSSNRCPRAIEYFLHHEAEYKRSLAFIHNPPEGVEIIQLFPRHTLASKLLGSSTAELDRDYRLGRQTGFRFLKRESLSALKSAA